MLFKAKSNYITKNGENIRVTLTYGLTYQAGSLQPKFRSHIFTQLADKDWNLVDPSAKEPYMKGIKVNEVLNQCFSEYKDILRLQGCMMDGTPCDLHEKRKEFGTAVRYYMSNYTVSMLAQNFRTSEEELHSKLSHVMSETRFHDLLNSMRPRWKREADDALRRHHFNKEDIIREMEIINQKAGITETIVPPKVIINEKNCSYLNYDYKNLEGYKPIKTTLEDFRFENLCIAGSPLFDGSASCTTVKNTEFVNVDFRNCYKFDTCEFEGCSFINCKMNGMEFINSNFENCDFLECDMSRMAMYNSQFSNCLFAGNDMSSTVIKSKSSLYRTSLEDNQIDGLQLECRMADCDVKGSKGKADISKMKYQFYGYTPRALEKDAIRDELSGKGTSVISVYDERLKKLGMILEDYRASCVQHVKYPVSEIAKKDLFDAVLEFAEKHKERYDIVPAQDKDGTLYLSVKAKSFEVDNTSVRNNVRIYTNTK